MRLLRWHRASRVLMALALAAAATSCGCASPRCALERLGYVLRWECGLLKLCFYLRRSRRRPVRASAPAADPTAAAARHAARCGVHLARGSPIPDRAAPLPLARGSRRLPRALCRPAPPSPSLPPPTLPTACTEPHCARSRRPLAVEVDTFSWSLPWFHVLQNRIGKLHPL